jgi:FKBP-type peptidyl-prolyl cis-trans isomerase SlyD
MQISENKVVKLSYELYIHEEDEEFEIVEVAGDDDPLVFLFGNSGLPQDFETQLIGLKSGDTFNFVLEPQEGFGDFSDEDIAEFPISMFQIEDGKIPEGLLEQGNFVPFTNEDGSQLMGRIHEIDGEVVLVDFNHPLAGKTLKFEGKIIEVRDATADEISHGHVHGDGGVHH